MSHGTYGRVTRHMNRNMSHTSRQLQHTAAPRDTSMSHVTHRNTMSHTHGSCRKYQTPSARKNTLLEYESNVHESYHLSMSLTLFIDTNESCHKKKTRANAKMQILGE